MTGPCGYTRTSTSNDVAKKRFVSGNREQFAWISPSGLLLFLWRKSFRGSLGQVNIKIPVPPRNVRKKISAFLDFQCSEIDAISADIQKEIETLEQYKRSVITEAVTKGLNPDVEMKDSGIEWVESIPAHWDVRPLYYYFAERKKKNYLGQEQNLLSLSYGKVIRKDINTSSLTKPIRPRPARI